MEKYAILLGFFDKQMFFLKKLSDEIIPIELKSYEKRYLFAVKIQQFFTAIENLFKQIAKAFEKHIEDFSNFHKELLVRMNIEIPKIRPAVISNESFLFLNKAGAFFEFFCHAYDCELNEQELVQLQERFVQQISTLYQDLAQFRLYVEKLANG